MKLIVGLGNPGRRYERTRHNVGWWVLDHLADVWRFGSWKSSGESLMVEGLVGTERVRLRKPQTFMNLSGQALRADLKRTGFDPRAELLVVVDEAAIPVGRFRLRHQGSAGGHNGLKDVERAVGHQHYARLRIGVGPTQPEAKIGDLADYVLDTVPSGERAVILGLVPTIESACDSWVRDGIAVAMNKFNGGAARTTDLDE